MTLPYNPDPFDTPDVSVSPISVKTYLPNGPKIGTWIELWFGSGSHIDPGYKSNDPATVAAQVATIKARGFDYVALDWYGTNVQPQHSATLLWVAECEKQGLPFVIDFDKGVFQFNVPTGASLTTYGLQQMQFVANNFFTSSAYMKHTDGRYLLLNWDCASVTGLDCTKVFSSVPNVAVLYEHSQGVSQPASSGCFAWVGLPDPTSYQTDFLTAVTKSKAANPKEVVIASLVKGFDDHGRRGTLDPTKSCWNQTQPYRYYPENQGQTFLDRVGVLRNYLIAHPGVVDYILVNTHNDYEEDTTVSERGIDSQLTVSLVASNGTLTATLTGNLNTVNHIEFNVNGQVSSVPVAATASLAIVPPVGGQQNYNCQVTAVGKALMQNKFSNTVITTATTVPAQTVGTSYTGDVMVPLPQSFDIPINTTQSGFTIAGTFTVPLPPTQSVTVQDQPITVTIKTKTIWT